MARRKRGTVGSKFVAEAALTQILSMAYAFVGDDARKLAEHVVREAWDVEHLPVANQVVITLDLQSLDKPAGGE